MGLVRDLHTHPQERAAAMKWEAPIGHSIAAHRTHGWCASCPDRSAADEIVAWRLDATDRHAAASAEEATPQEDIRE